MAKQIIDPYQIDINLVNTTDIQSVLTDYIELLYEFPEENALISAYRHTDHHSDPITSKVDFYNKLNNGDIDINTMYFGVSSTNIKRNHIISKNYRDQLPDTVVLATEDNTVTGDPNTIDAVSVEVKINQTEKKWISPPGEITEGEWKVEKTSKSSTAKAIKHLDEQDTAPEYSEKFGFGDMSVWFIQWWLDKFRISHAKVKEEVMELLGDDNEYFVNFSESVGQLKNIDVTYDTSTTHVWDTRVAAFGTLSIPETIPSIAEYCLKKETKSLASELSEKTNQLYRQNIVKLMEDPSKDKPKVSPLPGFSRWSHGNNLVADSEHPVRITKFIETIRSELKDHLKGLYDILEALSVRENYMTVGKPKEILMKVEGFTVAVDSMKNKVWSQNKLGEYTEQNYGKPVPFNQRSDTNSYLNPS